MRYLFSLIFLIFGFITAEAQYRVTFKLKKYPGTHGVDSVFVAGDFNEWNPGNAGYKLVPTTENNYELAVDLTAGLHEFKFTRGDWRKVECMANGKDIDNRYLQVKRDTTIEINIKGWKDDFEGVVNKRTASKQVHIIDTGFFMPQLSRSRRIWIYLPEGYAKSKKRYPVLYMHDGQNLFDASTAAFGEWGVDECLDTLIRNGKPACIVVGIDNGPKRMNEYNPYDFQKFGEGEGDKYLAFIVQTLKPFIDKKYKTLPSKENTIIAGSSMGGLISYYAMLQYPGVFGKGGIFSPAFWTATPSIKTVSTTLGEKMDGKLFFYMGEQEGGTYVQDMKDVQEILGERSDAMIYAVIDPEAGHNEQAWRKWFAEFYNWIMAEGFNVIQVK